MTHTLKSSQLIEVWKYRIADSLVLHSCLRRVMRATDKNKFAMLDVPDINDVSLDQPQCQRQLSEYEYDCFPNKHKLKYSKKKILHQCGYTA